MVKGKFAQPSENIMDMIAVFISCMNKFKLNTLSMLQCLIVGALAFQTSSDMGKRLRHIILLLL